MNPISLMLAFSSSTNEIRIMTPAENPSVKLMKRRPGSRKANAKRLPMVVDNPASAVSNSARSWVRKPADPITMMPISNSFTYRMKRDFSYLSASCPAVAENRKNGSMNNAPLMIINVLEPTAAVRATWNASNVISAFL